MKVITVLQLTQLVGLQSSTIQVVLPAQIQFRYLQFQQVSALKTGMPYKEKTVLNNQTLIGELIQLPTVSTSVSPKNRNALQRENCSKQSDTGRTAAVDRKPTILQWEVSNSDQTSTSNTNRCLNGRLRSQLHGMETGGNG